MHALQKKYGLKFDLNMFQTSLDGDSKTLKKLFSAEKKNTQKNLFQLMR